MDGALPSLNEKALSVFTTKMVACSTLSKHATRLQGWLIGRLQVNVSFDKYLLQVNVSFAKYLLQVNVLQANVSNSIKNMLQVNVSQVNVPNGGYK